MSGQVSKTVVATTGGTTLVGMATTVLTIVQALNGHPTNAGGLVSGNLLTIVGLIGTIIHYHKGASLMATQNDVENVVNRLRNAWSTFKSSGGLQRAEVDISSAVQLAEEIEAEVQKVSGTPTAQGASQTAPESVQSGTEVPAAPAASDFSKLAQ